MVQNKSKMENSQVLNFKWNKGVKEVKPAHQMVQNWLFTEDTEDEAINKIEAEQLEEDHYIKVDEPEEGCFPVSESKDLESDVKIKRVYKKGQPLLHEIF